MILPSAGRGERFGATMPKQYVPLAGESTFARTIRRCAEQEEVERILVATSPDARDMAFAALPRELRARVEFVDGGDTRQRSVINAVEVAALESDELIAVHDVVRPFFTRALFLALLDAAERHGAAVPLLPLSDTLHHVREGFVADSPARNEFGLAQTPQIFRFSVLRDALRAAERDGVSGTDEAAVVRLAGHQVRVVAGEADNFKITLPADFARAEALIQGVAR